MFRKDVAGPVDEIIRVGMAAGQLISVVVWIPI